jgi:hypothetical protein
MNLGCKLAIFEKSVYVVTITTVIRTKSQKRRKFLDIELVWLYYEQWVLNYSI